MTPAIERKLLHAVLITISLIFALRAFIWMQAYLVEYDRMSTLQMVTGEAIKPFVYRLLVPQTAALIALILPPSMHELLSGAAHSLAELFWSVANVRPTNALPEPVKSFYLMRFITGVLMLGFLAEYGVAMWRLAARLFPETPVTKHAALMLGYAIIPIGSWTAAFMYDPATLCFSAWGFLLLLEQRWRAYLILFSLACLNKETAFYIICVFAVCQYDQLPRPYFLKLLSIQFVILCVIISSVHLLFADNPGRMAEYHLHEYLAFFVHIVPFRQLLIMLAGMFLFLYQWPQKPEMLRRTGWVVALSIVVWVVFGRIQEVRALYDIFPFATLFLTHTLAVATGAGKARIFASLATDNLT